jgi:hypothetical protein
MKRTRFVRTVLITGMAVLMMAASTRADTVTYDTNKAGIGAGIITPRQSTVQGPGWATILFGIGCSLIILSRYGRKKTPPASADYEAAGRGPNVLLMPKMIVEIVDNSNEVVSVPLLNPAD